jgi:hypothetical protein
MPEIYSATASEVKVENDTIAGLQAIEYSMVRNRQDVGAIGTGERIAVYFGLKVVTGRLRVASASKSLDGLLQSGASFTISATLKHGETIRRLTFFDCYMEDKQFSLSALSHGETIYAFTATNIKEE